MVGYVDFYLAEGTIAKVLETVPYVNLAGRGARRLAGGLGGPLASLLRRTGRVSSETRPVRLSSGSYARDARSVDRR